MDQTSSRLLGSAEVRQPGWIKKFLDSDLFYSFCRSPIAVFSFAVLVLFLLVGLLAPVIAPHDPYDLASLSILDSLLPPAMSEGGTWRHILGTDSQGRDLLSAILYGTRSSIVIAISAVVLALVVGIAMGLVSGYFGGAVDAVIMRVIDVMLSFPSLLVALLVSGIMAAIVPPDWQSTLQVYILIFAIGFSSWPKFARTVRAGVIVERGKEYVVAAKVISVGNASILIKHILPNVLPSLLVVATLTLGLAVLDEATLSFLGVGLPPTQPSLGSLIRLGNEVIYSGEWWIAVFPTIALVVLVLSVNLFGDWLRDALNSRL
jgi:peptide/nickel transport system permease protein